MEKILLIALGGGLGSVVRYLCVTVIQKMTGHPFPWGTFAVNVIGCVCIGFLHAAFLHALPMREEHRLAILVGVLGGFTTFSSFAWESVTLASGGQFVLAMLNITVSNILGLGAAWLSHRAGLWMLGTGTGT